MSERYSKIFSLPENLYSESAPVIIKAGALLRDNNTSWLIAQLKFQNITDKIITRVKVELIQQDSFSHPVGDPLTYEYSYLNVERGSDFGSQSPIKISNSGVTSYTVRVIGVYFADGTTWSDNGKTWESLPNQNNIGNEITDKETLLGYKAVFGKNSNYKAIEHKDIWICACGEINHSFEEQCYKCNSSLSQLKALDYNVLKIEGMYALAINCYNLDNAAKVKEAISIFETLHNFKDSQALLQKANEKLAALATRNQIETKAKKKKIMLKILIPCAAVLTILFGYFVGYPMVARLAGNHMAYIDMYNVKDYKIPNGTKEIKGRAFFGCDSITSITIPDSVTSIGDSAFYDCGNICSVVIGNGVKTIGESAFDGCSQLDSLVIGNSVETIGFKAFSECEILTSVLIPSSVTKIDMFAFSRCYNLNSVIIGTGVKTIGKGAFEECEALTTIVIPNNVTTIEEEAFSYCDNLTSIVIGNGVTSIGAKAFYKCNALKDIYYIGTKEQWDAIDKPYIDKYVNIHYNYIPVN